MTYDGTARHSSDYFLRSSHAHGFFSEEERARRRAVLERINAVEGRSDSGFDHTWNQHDVANEAIQNERRESFDLVNNADTGVEHAGERDFHQNHFQNQEIERKALLDATYANDKNEEIFQSVINSKNVRDEIATKAFYTSTTQKLYQGADWDASRSRRPKPPSTVIEPRPDMVTQRIRRYEDTPERWQKFSSKPFNWDYLQTRNGHYLRRPFAFTSQCEKVGQIPNYTGHVAGEGEKDVNGESFTPMTKLRLEKPRSTITSKRGYVPGYTGCVLWANAAPPLSAEREPRRESTARVHKPISTPRTSSASKHQGPLSRMVTLTHPFNPFNKKNPFDGLTASGNRV